MYFSNNRTFLFLKKLFYPAQLSLAYEEENTAILQDNLSTDTTQVES